jgi:hypothetical protein
MKKLRQNKKKILKTSRKGYQLVVNNGIYRDRIDKRDT